MTGVDLDQVAKYSHELNCDGFVRLIQSLPTQRHKYRDSATLAQLGSQFGASPNVVRRVLLAADVVLRARGGSKPRQQ